MRQQSFGDVDRDAAQEDEEHEEPFEVLKEGAEEASLASSITESGESNVTKGVEDDNKGDPDVPGVDVVFINVCESQWVSDGRVW